jgi:hypothetical protein
MRFLPHSLIKLALRGADRRILLLRAITERAEKIENQSRMSVFKDFYSRKFF